MDTHPAPESSEPMPSRERPGRRAPFFARDDYSTQELDARGLNAGHLALEEERLPAPGLGSSRNPFTWMVWGLLLLANVFSAGLLLGRNLKPAALPPDQGASAVAPAAASLPQAPVQAPPAPPDPIAPASIPRPVVTPVPPAAPAPRAEQQAKPKRTTTAKRATTAKRPSTAPRNRTQRRPRREFRQAREFRPRRLPARPQRPTVTATSRARPRRTPRQQAQSGWEGYHRTVLRALDRLPQGR